MSHPQSLSQSQSLSPSLAQSQPPSAKSHSGASGASGMSFQELLQRSRQLNGVVLQAQTQSLSAHHPLANAAAPFSANANANAALLHRSLNQVAERSLLLAERSANDPSVSLRSSLPFAASSTSNANLDATAQSFLASAGVNAHQLKRDLDSLDVSTTLDPVHPVADTDYTSYLNNEHDNLILSTMEQAKQKSAWDLDCLVAQANNADWEFSKRAFFTSLSLPLATMATAAAGGAPDTPATADHARAFGASDRFRNTAAPFSSAPTLAASSPTSPASYAATSAKSATFLKALACSNESGFNSNIFADFRVASSGPLPRASSAPNTPLAATNSHFNNPDTNHLAPLWDLLNALLASSAPLSHAPNYLATPAASMSFLLDLFARSRKYLESNFFDMIEETVQRNPAVARAGGDPSPIHRVAAYARARHGKAGLKWDIPHVELTATQQGDVPLWAVVYYLVRAGRTPDAVQFLKNHQEAVLPADAHFYMYLAAWAQGGVEDGSALQRDLRDYHAHLVQQQQQSVEAAVGMSTAQRYGFGYSVDNAVDGVNDFAVQGVDPFKMAIIKLVGRCDLSNKKMDRIVVPSTEDWLWVRLVTIGRREYLPQDLQADVLPLESLFTQQHPAMFATVLATVGLFDHAVIHLLKAGNLVQDALHVALALMHVGCLRLPSDPTDVLGMQVDASTPSSSASATAALVKTVPIHTLIAQYLSSPAMSGATALEKLQYLVRLPLYAVGTSSSSSATSTASGWQAPFVHWRDYALDQLVPWAMAYPSGQALTVHPRLLAMLGLADMPGFHALVTRRAAEVARAQDKLDVAVYLSAQALDPRSVFETLHAMLARAIVHGPSMLALGAAASVSTTAAAGSFGASVSGIGTDMHTVVQAADFVLAHFGGARSLNDFAGDVAELRQLEGMRDVALLLRDVLNVKAVATESALVGATNSMMGAGATVTRAARVSPIDALNTLHELNLIPYGSGDLAACFERVKRLPVVAHGVVPVVLKLAMDLVVRVCRDEAKAAAAGLGGGSMQQQHFGAGQVEACKAMAQAVRQFAGIVPFVMDASVHAYLAGKLADLSRY